MADGRVQFLLLMVLMPVVGAMSVMFVSRQGIKQIRLMALINVLLSLGLAAWMVVEFDPAKDGLYGQTDVYRNVEVPGEGWVQELVAVSRISRTVIPWLAASEPEERPVRMGIQIALGVDGISLWLIALTSLLMLPSVLVSWETITDRPAAYYALLLLLQAGLIGVFAAQDIILFYLFFEFTLIPLFFMIGLWGGYDRRWAARKFFIYTFAGSVLTFLGLLYIVLAHAWMWDNSHWTFSIPELTRQIPMKVAENPALQQYWLSVSPWIFAALFAGFAIKVPLFPFHTWLPLAHVEAPTAGSVLLAGVLLKIGSYGFLRFALPLVPHACFQWLHIIGTLSVVGIVYGALLALAQKDIKKLVAYSSVSHMGFCMLGLFALNNVGITGGVLQMINHGLSTGALFAIVGMLYERYHTRDIESYGGLARKFPVLAFCLGVVTFSSIALPGLNGFTGEVLSLLGMFKTNRVYAICGLSGTILGAWYMLWLVQRTFFGRLREPLVEGHAEHGAAAHQTGPAMPTRSHHGAGQHETGQHGTGQHGTGQHGTGQHGTGQHGTGQHGTGQHAAHEVTVGNPAIHDLKFREIFALAPILVLIVVIGVYPQFFISRVEPAISRITQGLDTARLQAANPARVIPVVEQRATSAKVASATVP